MSIRNFIKKNIISFSVIVFVLVYVIIIKFKPNFLYTRDGNLRSFGLGYKNKTIIPLWLVAIIISILSYIIVLYWLTFPSIQF